MVARHTELVLQDVNQVRILGHELTKDGVRPASFVKSMLKRIVKRVQILWAHNIENSCRWEVVVYLYKSYAGSILAYSLPFLETDTWSQISLQKSQNEFAVGVLRGGEAMSGFFAGAELGLVDMDLQRHKAVLLVYTGIMANAQDTLSHSILNWKFPDSPSEADIINNILQNLGLDYKAQDLSLLGRVGLKRDLNAAIAAKQQQRWIAGLKAGGESHRAMERRKPKWGLEPNLGTQHANKARRYIHVRMDAYQPKTPPGLNFCTRCPCRVTSTQHELWSCPATLPERVRWLDRLRRDLPGVWDTLTSLPLDEATDFILGAGEVKCGKSAWDVLQRKAVSFIWKMTEGEDTE